MIVSPGRKLVRAASTPHEVLRWTRTVAAAPRSAHLQGSESSGEVRIRTNWLERKACGGCFGGISWRRIAEPATLPLPPKCCAVPACDVIVLFLRARHHYYVLEGSPRRAPLIWSISRGWPAIASLPLACRLDSGIWWPLVVAGGSQVRGVVA